MIPRSLSIFFPMYNERENIAATLDQALAVIPRLGVANYELLVIDDGSKDDSAETVRQYMRNHPRVRMVQHPQNMGYGAALRTGFTSASLDAVFYTDSDLPIDLADIARALPLLERADLVIGYRIRRFDTPRRAVYSKVYNLLMRVLFGVRVRDVNFSFKLVSRKVLDHIRLSAATVFIDGQLLAEAKRHGFVVAELPIDYRPRKVGSSSFNSLRAAWDTLVEMLRHRFAPSSLPEPVPLQVIGAESTERIASSSPDLEAAAGTTAEGLDDLGASVLSQAETSQDPLRKVSAANLS